MRSLEVAMRMTHGLGMTQRTLIKWAYALPRCISSCSALKKFTRVEANSSEKHKDLRPSSEKKDDKAMKVLIQWLDAHSSFSFKMAEVLISLPLETPL